MVVDHLNSKGGKASDSTVTSELTDTSSFLWKASGLYRRPVTLTDTNSFLWKASDSTVDQ